MKISIEKSAFLIAYFLFIPFAQAEGYRVKIRENVDNGAAQEIVCKKLLQVCHVELSLQSKIYQGNSIKIDFFYDDGGVRFQFLWQQQYLYAEQNSSLYISTPKGESAKRQVVLYIPSPDEKKSQAYAEAVIRSPLERVAELEIYVKDETVEEP